MTSRVNAFKELKLQTPAVYLDTDILVTGRIPQLETMTASSVMLCRRSFMRDAVFNTGLEDTTTESTVARRSTRFILFLPALL